MAWCWSSKVQLVTIDYSSFSSSIWHWICYEFLLNGRQQTECWAVAGGVGCRVKLFRSLQSVLFINFNKFLVQCVTHACDSRLQSHFYQAVLLNGNLIKPSFLLCRILSCSGFEFYKHLINVSSYLTVTLSTVLVTLYSCNLNFRFLMLSMHCFSLYCGIWQTRWHCKQDFTVLCGMLNLLFRFTLPRFTFCLNRTKIGVLHHENLYNSEGLFL